MIATAWDNVPEQELKEPIVGLAGKLHIERIELSNKIEKLKTFMTMSPDFKNVNYFHKRLLDSQLTTMQNYENILVQRMTDLNNPDKIEN
jgi:hypothetical protein